MSKDIGAIIKGLRKKANLTQEQLSERSGVSWPYIGQIERGDRDPSLKTLGKIAGGLDVTPDVFFIEKSIVNELNQLPSVLIEFSRDKSKSKLLAKMADLTGKQMDFLDMILPAIKTIK